MKLATFLLLLLAVNFAVVPASSNETQRRKSRNQKVASLQGRLSALHKKKQQLQRQLHGNKALTHQTLVEIARVDQQLDQVESALEVTTQQLGESKVQQKQVEGELNVATKRMLVVKEQVKQRLRRIYASGPTSTLSVLLGSKTGGELAGRADTMSEIAQSDQKIFMEYRALRAEVADRKQAADALVLRVTNLARRQEQEQEDLQNARETKKHKVQELKQQAGELEEAIAQFEQDEQQIQSQIDTFMRRLSQSGIKLPPFAGGFIRPVPGRITSGFGYRYHPILHITRLHAGIDFAAPNGTPVRAAASGIIIAAQYMRGFGNMVSIAHGSNLQTVYGHLSRFYVHPGQRVTKGQVIAASGATGLATGPHLHFELHVNGRAVNPLGRI